MKIAVCFSSQLRGGIYTFQNIKKYLGEVYKDCVFFAHLWDINTRKPYVRTGEIFLPETIPVDMQELYVFKELYNIKHFIVENYDTVEKEQTKNHTYFYPLFYSWYKSLELLKTYELETGDKFDLVIKLRPDIMFSPERKFSKEVLSAFIKYNSTNIFLVENLLESWRTASKDTHMNDVCWISTPDLMNLAKNYFFETQKNRKTFLEYLKNNNVELCNLEPSNSGYCCVKLECVHYAALQNYKKCFECEQFYFMP